jgi:site-specific recombinase XerD
MSLPKFNIDQIFETHIETLAITLQPNSITNYRSTAKLFVYYLRSDFPRVRRLSQLRRDPHLLGWFRGLCDQRPPLCSLSRMHHLVRLRRLFNDLAANGHRIQPDLIRLADLPRVPKKLPRALSPDDDHRLQQELRQADDLYANALLLMRATGIRRSECSRLTLDCLRQLDRDQWALHVPLGKTHTERLVPADEEVRRLVDRILALRTQAPARLLARSDGWLLPRCPIRYRSRRPCGDFIVLENELCAHLVRDAERAGCSQRVTPHQLRHTFATEMVRLHVSLPAVMQLLGHKDLRMTLRYVQVTQQDLQREFHTARQNAQQHLVPKLALPASSSAIAADLPGVSQVLAAARHLLETYRRQLSDEKTSRKLRRLDKRLLSIAAELQRFNPPEK